MPFATAGGSPKNMKSDSEIMVPPPASVLIKPTSRPDVISAMAVVMLILFLLLQISRIGATKKRILRQKKVESIMDVWRFLH